MIEKHRLKVEYYSPLEASPDEQAFGVCGFVRDEGMLSLDISYNKGGKDMGTILRTPLSDGYSFSAVNWILDFDEERRPIFIRENAAYDTNLYDPKKMLSGGSA